MTVIIATTLTGTTNYGTFPMIPDDCPPRDLIVTIPGISINLADVIIAETGADMTRFPSARHLASCDSAISEQESAKQAVAPVCLCGRPCHDRGRGVELEPDR